MSEGSTESRIRAGEWRSVAYATSWFFFILFGYLILRPVRESLGVGIGRDGLASVMWMTLAAMLVAVPVYAYLVSALPRRWLVRVVYHFFAACAIVFFLLMQIDNPMLKTKVAYAYFVWVNILALFATSVFWSVLADLFDNEQGKRLFGMIAGGGTAGAICGSLVTIQLAKYVETYWLLLIPAVLLEFGLVLAWRLEKNFETQTFIRERSNNAGREPIEVQNGDPEKKEGKVNKSGGIWTGIVEVTRSPYLAMICLFLFFVQAFGTQLYFQQASIVRSSITSEAERTSFFASVDLGTQCLTLFLQFCVAGLVMRRMGVRFALVALPVVYLIGFAGLAVSSSLSMIVVAVVAARGVGYGLTVPAREVLFTVVTREQKYKSKNFIDTLLLRGADATSGAAFAKFGAMGIVNSTLNLLALPLVILWGASAIWLGRRQQKMASSQPSDAEDAD